MERSDFPAYHVLPYRPVLLIPKITECPTKIAFFDNIASYLGCTVKRLNATCNVFLLLYDLEMIRLFFDFNFKHSCMKKLETH